MKLLIDFGNSRCKWATLDNKQLQVGSAISYTDKNTSAEVEQIVASLPLQACKELHAVSVLADSFNQEFAKHLQSSANVQVTFHASQCEAFGIRLAYADPTSYGADRYAALVAAHHAGDGAKIIVDCGTAVTVDAIDDQGTHLGGLIIPGVDLMCSMLTEKTQVTATTDIRQPIEIFNATTQNAVYSGSTLCLRHGLRSIIDQIRTELAGQVSVFITGGATDTLVDKNIEQTVMRPELVLEGLEIMQRS